jgi:plastocyanin
MRRHLPVVAAFVILTAFPVLAAKTITVVQRGLELDTKSLSLSKGDRINFENQDDVIHNIHIFGPGADEEQDLGLQKPGERLNYKFDKNGLFLVRCNIHPSIKMSVTVK